MCRHEHELCQHDLRGLSKYEINQHYFDFIRNATKEEREANGFENRYGIGVYKCRICGEIIFCRKDSFKSQLQLCKNNCNGIKIGNIGRGGFIVIIGYNDLATTHPQMIKYFPNIKDIYTHSHGSTDEVDLICPDCGQIKRMEVRTLISQGFSCDFCSDGISYPEKLMALVLKALGIKFKKQHKINGYGEYSYDFYLIDYDIIIELHGGQHYEEVHRHSNWKSYKDEHDNDLIKYDIAVLNEYEYNKDYFIINAKYSKINYIKQNIYNCSFFQQFNLDNIDWQEIDIEAQKSIKIEVCKYWKEQKEINKDLTVNQMVDIFGISDYAVTSYLKWGNEKGLCTYNGKDEKEVQAKRDSKFVYLIKPDGSKWFNEPMSQKQLAEISKISLTTISRYAINGKPLKCNGRANYNSKYKGSYVVEAK